MLNSGHHLTNWWEARQDSVTFLTQVKFHYNIWQKKKCISVMH